MNKLQLLVVVGGIVAFDAAQAQAQPDLKVTDHFLCSADLLGKSAKDDIHQEVVYDAERGSAQTDPHWVPGATMTASQGGVIFQLTPHIHLSLTLAYQMYTSTPLRAGAQFTCLAYDYGNDEGSSTSMLCPTPALSDSSIYDPVLAMTLPQTQLDPNGVAIFRAQDLPAVGRGGGVGGERWREWRANCAYLSTTETPR